MDRKILTLILGLITINNFLNAQQDSVLVVSNGLQTEIMLHPADGFTGYVLKKGEFAYNQALTPYPSWAWWGITDKITTELDFECWLGGVPSFNFRFGLLKQKKIRPSVSFETMFQYLKDERDQFENLDYLNVIRQGKNWYNHINLSWQIADIWHVYLSGGATYIDNTVISNGDTLHEYSKSFRNYISPDFSISLDYRFKKWISFHSTASYGSTFLYADNIIRKEQIILATRIAPFINNDKRFFNSFRIELAFIRADFIDAKESITGPIGFLYWQWNRNKKK
ncbi:MAG TPA: hypothetical protein DD653_09800 [Marinilabiliales bacterium]|nr:MAG: hypothetical protein A2W84_14925 [Bacteroidetes bacterium GWC2_40_13]HBO74965.1 hypothetical protein [Marinilabiliales bacterium]